WPAGRRCRSRRRSGRANGRRRGRARRGDRTEPGTTGAGTARANANAARKAPRGMGRRRAWPSTGHEWAPGLVLPVTPPQEPADYVAERSAEAATGAWAMGDIDTSGRLESAAVASLTRISGTLSWRRARQRGARAAEPTCETHDMRKPGARLRAQC